MTMEYISVKLCRLFVHDDFPNPTTKANLPEYAFYDYTNPNLSAEAKLVHDCMLAWWNSNPRGQTSSRAHDDLQLGTIPQSRRLDAED